MRFRKMIGFVCVFVGSALLAIGFTVVSQILAIAVGLILLLIGFSARHWPSSSFSVFTFLVSVCVAVAGVISGALPVCMLLGFTFALASWDLSNLDQFLKNQSTSANMLVLEKLHYQNLLLALGLGLLISIVGRNLQIQFPFAGIIILVFLFIIGLDRIWRTFER
jgi:hypothetical protein